MQTRFEHGLGEFLGEQRNAIGLASMQPFNRLRTALVSAKDLIKLIAAPKLAEFDLGWGQLVEFEPALLSGIGCVSNRHRRSVRLTRTLNVSLAARPPAKTLAICGYRLRAPS